MTKPALKTDADSTSRWRWLLAIPAGALLAAAVYPLDGAAAEWAGSVRLGGDLRRAMETLQQFGQGSSIVLVMLLIWTLDPPRRRRLLGYAGVLAVTYIAVQGMKMLIGRPRPKFDDPGHLLGPFGAYPVDPGSGRLHHAWEIGTGASSDLWSMPSSHTAFAVVMAVFLGRLYPRGWWVFAGLAVIVGASRVVLGAHYPSDVVLGAGLGLGIAMAAVRAERGGGRSRR